MARKKVKPDSLWAYKAVNEFMDYLEKAEGEAYDAVVYDIGYDFDPASIDALRYVVCAVREKNYSLYMPNYTNMVMSVPFPSDGSVVYANSYSGSPEILRRKDARIAREKEAVEKGILYVPDADEYISFTEVLTRAPYRNGYDTRRLSDKELRKHNLNTWWWDGEGVGTGTSGRDLVAKLFVFGVFLALFLIIGGACSHKMTVSEFLYGS